MKQYRRRYIAIVSVLTLMGVIAFQHYLLVRSERIQDNLVAAIAASFSPILNIENRVESDVTLNEKASSDIRKALIPLSLAIISLELDMATLSAPSFEGLCDLTARAEKLFPEVEHSDLESQVNALLTMRLVAMRAELRRESLVRAGRIGDQHKCAAAR